MVFPAELLEWLLPQLFLGFCVCFLLFVEYIDLRK